MFSDQLHQVNIQPWLPNEDSYFNLLYLDGTVAAVSSPDSFLSNIMANYRPAIASLSISPSPEHEINTHILRTANTVSDLAPSDLPTPVASPQLPPDNSVLIQRKI